MSCIRILVAFIYVYYLNEISQCSKDDAFVFTECNATLVWNLGNDSTELLVYIMNPNASAIIEMENNQCTNRNNSFVKCIVYELDMEVFVSVIIINTKINDSGNYTAWIRKGFAVIVPFSKRLTVIDKPQIMMIGKPILHESFIVTCNISFIHECLTFRWKIKGTDVEYASSDNASKLKFTNLTTMESSITLQCKVGMEKCVDSNHPHHICVSAESDTYTVRPYYGPYNVFFNLTDNNIYLKENQTFTVKCYADCYPVCIFRWESFYMNVENEELVVNRFESTKAGPYTCIARNRETNVTVKSRPVFLHHMKDFIQNTTIHSTITREDTEFLLKILGIGLFIAAVSLVTVGVLLVLTNRRKYASRRLGSQTVNEPCSVSSNRALNQDLHFNIRDRPLPIPTTQERTCRMLVGSSNPRINRKSRSCGAFFDDNNDAWNSVRQTLSLQTLIQSSHEIGRRVESVDSIIKPYFPTNISRCSINGPENGITLQELYSNVRKNKQISDIQQNPGERLHRLNNFQEDQYSTVDETSLSVYDYARENKQEGNLQTIHGNAEAGSNDSDYDYATLK